VLDFGWAELLIIIAVAVFVVGPQDIPKIMYGLGRLMRRFQYIKFAVPKQFDEVMNVADIEDLRKGVNFEVRGDDDSVDLEIKDDEPDERK